MQTTSGIACALSVVIISCEGVKRRHGLTAGQCKWTEMPLIAAAGSAGGRPAGRLVIGCHRLVSGWSHAPAAAAAALAEWLLCSTTDGHKSPRCSTDGADTTATRRPTVRVSVCVSTAGDANRACVTVCCTRALRFWTISLMLSSIHSIAYRGKIMLCYSYWPR